MGDLYGIAWGNGSVTVVGPDRAYAQLLLREASGPFSAFDPAPAVVQMAERHIEDCPECRQGKCRNCTGWSLDPGTDELVDCPCAEGGHL